jgi:hypothetical protein
MVPSDGFAARRQRTAGTNRMLTLFRRVLFWKPIFGQVGTCNKCGTRQINLAAQCTKCGGKLCNRCNTNGICPMCGQQG